MIGTSAAAFVAWIERYSRKLSRKTGVDPWQRFFQNLRACRETERFQEHTIHLVTAGLGNTPKVAMEHYLQVRDEDFAKAAQIPAQQLFATRKTAPHRVPTENKEPLVSQAKPTKQGAVESRLAAC